MTQAFVNLGVTQAMSPNINSFVGDLVAMAQAMERVPQLEAELSNTKDSLERSMQHAQGLESNILSYKQQIEDLQSKVRSLEVERDDASFRVLEAEDINHVILGLARSAATNLAAITERLEPPKPEPEVAQATEAPHPDASPPDWKQDQAETSRMPPDQSATDPTASTIATSSGSVSSAETQDTVPTSNPNPDVEGAKPLGPYFNKLYYQQANPMPLHEWLAGDGTETDYHWRPSFRYAPEY